MSNLKPINLAETLSLYADTWHPRAVGQFNGHDLTLVKVEGASHDPATSDTDGFYYVIKGQLDIEMSEGTVTLGSGDMYVVPKGVAHWPVARPVADILTIKPEAVSAVKVLPMDWV